MEINILKYLTMKRVWNAVKIFTSFSISRVTGKPVIYGMPFSYSIEPTNHCNFQCPECPSGLGALTRPLGLLSISDFQRIVNEIAPTGIYVQLYFQGEPYINKQLPEMIAYAQSKKLYVSISTNGSLVNEKNVDKILDYAPDKLIFSIDGLDEESYKNYRVGGTFAQADKGLRLLAARKKERGLKKPYLELQFIVMKQNENQIETVFDYGKDAGIDKVTLKTMQVSSLENANHFLPANEKYRRYIVTDTDLKMKGGVKNFCFAIWRTAVITWDGKVVPCCFDKDADHLMGELHQQNIKEVWQGEGYQSFRAKILENRKGVPMCTNCTEGLRVNIMEIES